MATGDFLDLYTDSMNRVGIPTGNSAALTKFKRLINQGLLNWATQKPWPSLIRRAELRLFAPYSTGTIAVTQGSATITGTTTLWNTNNAFTEKNVQATFKLQVGGDSEIYEVSSITNDTTIVLLSKYTNTTATGKSYKAWQDEYALASDFDRPVDMRQLFDDITLRPLGLREFRSKYSNANTQGKPLRYTMGRNRAGLVRIFFYPYPDKAMILPYDYITSNLAQASSVDQAELSGDTDTPNIPLKYRILLVHYAVAQWYRDYKDDVRAGEALGFYNGLVAQMAGDQEVHEDRPRFRLDRSKYQWRRRVSPANADLGWRFDNDTY